MTLTQPHLYDVSTAANFRDWGQSIGLAIASFGWIQTADTGQVNWATVAAPAAGTFVYEIWRPGDALTPFYVKLEFGNNSGGNGPAIRISSGSGTNGAGVLTGVLSNVRNIVGLVGNQGAITYVCNYSGDPSYFAVCMWHSGGSNCVFAFERSRNAYGQATPAYWTQYQCVGDAGSATRPTASMQSVVFGVGAAQEGSSATEPLAFNCIVGPATTSSSTGVESSQSLLFNNQIGISPVFPYVGYFDYPGLVFVMIPMADFTDAYPAGPMTTFSVTLLGKSHTYGVLKYGPYGAFGQVCPGMRWE